jgi:peptidase C25-like protein
MDPKTLYCYGIDAETGDYLVPSMTVREVADLARRNVPEETSVHDLRVWLDHRDPSGKGPREGIDAKDLAQTGWGVIFAQNAEPAVQQALRPLLEHRRRQAGAKAAHYYQEYSGEDGYHTEESKASFLARQGAGAAGPADPENVPYYLLIVGSPEAIPYSFQYQLDVTYAVGRLHFDTPEEYGRYAQGVVAAELSSSRTPPRAVFFGPQSAEDMASAASANELVAPLCEELRTKEPSWDVRAVLKEKATKARLSRLLGGAETPALLFTAGHGVGFASGHERQLDEQGALLCADWLGHGHRACPTDYFAAGDLAEEARLGGLISFHFACYSAGMPMWDEYRMHERVPLAPHPFVSRLSQRLLAHPAGGALAVIGHVEKAWEYSFLWEKAGRQTQVFADALKRLMDGHPVGSAMEPFGLRYAELSTLLGEPDPGVQPGTAEDEAKLAALWIARNDARNYAVMGDPAVRLAVG